MSLLDRLKEKKKDMESKKQRDFAVVPPQNNSRWRIMPSFDGDMDVLPVADFGQHFIKDPVTKETLAVVACAAKTYGTACDICEQIVTVKAGLLAGGRTAEAEVVGESKSAGKHIVNASPWTRNPEGVPGGTLGDVVQLALPMTAFEQFMLIVENFLNEGINIFDLATGYDIIISRLGMGRNTKYTVQAAPLSTVADPALMGKAIDLNAYVNQITEEKRAKALAALGGPMRPALAAPAAVPALPASVTPVPAAAPALVPTPAVVPVAAAPVAAAPVAAAPVAAAPVAEVGGEAAPVADALAEVDLDDLDLEELNIDDCT